MATYIQGSDTYIYLSDSSLTVTTTATIYAFAKHLVFAGTPKVGDVVNVLITGSPDELDISVTATTTVLSDLIDLIEAAIDATSFTYTRDGATLDIFSPTDIVSYTIGTSLALSVIACTKSDVINTENEMMEVTQTESKSTAFLPTFQSKTLSIEQAAVMDVSTNQFDTKQLRTWTNEQTKLWFKFEMPDSTETGYCYIKSNSISGGVNTGALANFELQVTGATTLT